MELKDTEMNGATNDGITSPVWKAIWRMQVPNSVKSLVWRAGRNALPTRMNLVRRHILTDAMCPECKVQLEDTLHTLWSCPILQDVWEMSFSKLVTETGFSSSFLEVLECASTDKSLLELFAVTIQEIWQRRNKDCVGEPIVPVYQIASKAGALQEFQQLRPTHTVIPRTAHAIKWRPLIAPCVKANFDSAIFS